MSESIEKLITEIKGVVETVHRLRAPGGCPWDRAQTHQSLRRYLLEEAYEALEVLDQIDSVERLKEVKVREAFREELGDVLMQVLIHSEMANEVGAFDFADVARGLNEKLVRRHPHVFGESSGGQPTPVAKNADEALSNWEKRKLEEKAAKGASTASVLDGVPKALPGLSRAVRVIEKVTKVGFQWSDLEGPIAKWDEETAELKAELKGLSQMTQKEASSLSLERRAKIAHEMGDLLFCLANLSMLLKIDPEEALRDNLKRFESRFRHVERRLSEVGKKPEESDLAEMDRFWNEAKAIERGQASSDEKNS